MDRNERISSIFFSQFPKIFGGNKALNRPVADLSVVPYDFQILHDLVHRRVVCEVHLDETDELGIVFELGEQPVFGGLHGPVQDGEFAALLEQHFAGAEAEPGGAAGDDNVGAGDLHEEVGFLGQAGGGGIGRR